MKAFFSDLHAGHGERTELLSGELVPAFETPERAELVKAAFLAASMGALCAPDAHSLATAEKIHHPRYLEFLQSAWSEWIAAGRSGPCMPCAWRAPGMADASDLSKEPLTIDGRLGFWSFDTSSAFVAGTWDAVKAAYDCAVSAADSVSQNAAAAFAISRPPGHHAGRTVMGGYCFINNAAAAAQRLLDLGAQRVAILDVDYHHGNGTQDIFYARDDVFVANLHADPRFDYPHFLGFADETGMGAGEGFNLNVPLPLGTRWPAYDEALSHALSRLAAFKPDALVVSLGVDTYEHDPISAFKLTGADYPRLGERIATLQRPTAFVLEGGYAVADVGTNVVSVIKGFANAHPV
jgi:acetoin utilization deacetylase AcuC-like enzyme